jgi:DNA-directed RNA polymerase subunit RPC12/RpoP
LDNHISISSFFYALVSKTLREGFYHPLKEDTVEDITLKCKDCGADFVWTVGEQEFYQQKGLEHPPVRCKDCRGKRKSMMNNRRDG